MTHKVGLCVCVCVRAVGWGGGGCRPHGRWTQVDAHATTDTLYNIIASCAAPDDHKTVSGRVKWLDRLIKGP